MMSAVTHLKQEDQTWQLSIPNLLNLPHIEKTFWRGMTVYGVEDSATQLYVVLKGRVMVRRSSAEGQQKILSLRYRGDIFGELALTGGLGETRRSDEAVALDTTRVAIIRLADFWQAARRDPVLLQSTLQYVTRRLAEAQRQIESLVFDHNHRRLARALVELSQEAARAGESSVRLTHEELAELIGSTREVVTGMMIEFRQRGLIDYKRGDIRPSLPRLHQFLEEDAGVLAKSA
ncbi:MAG: Crp/Fnr family transcriptional regulator [Acidobacteria bacterium]|jgi:CRP-like cAMP-binding protein|nr:Crp/Fnr family transcriptional regulator [Acidobacteriota bacterium]